MGRNPNRREMLAASSVTIGAIAGCTGLAQESGQGQGQYDCPDGYSLLAKLETGGSGADCFSEDEEDESASCIEIVEYTTKEDAADNDCDEIVEVEWEATGDCVVYQIRAFGGTDEDFAEIDDEGETGGTFSPDLKTNGGQDAGISNLHFCGAPDEGDGNGNEDDENGGDENGDEEDGNGDNEDGNNGDGDNGDGEGGDDENADGEDGDGENGDSEDGDSENGDNENGDGEDGDGENGDGEDGDENGGDDEDSDNGDTGDDGGDDDDSDKTPKKGETDLEGVCYKENKGKAQFRIENHGKEERTFTWKVLGTMQTGAVSVPKHDSETIWVEMDTDQKLGLYANGDRVAKAKVNVADC